MPTLNDDGLELIQSGGLFALESEYLPALRRSIVLVDKILRGAKSADLPFERGKDLSLSVNLFTANALGLTIPQSVLDRATQVLR